jgi:hypothetical protein
VREQRSGHCSAYTYSASKWAFESLHEASHRRTRSSGFWTKPVILEGNASFTSWNVATVKGAYAGQLFLRVGDWPHSPRRSIFRRQYFRWSIERSGGFLVSHGASAWRDVFVTLRLSYRYPGLRQDPTPNLKRLLSLRKRFYSRSLVVIHIENGIELRDLHQIMDPFCEI